MKKTLVSFLATAAMVSCTPAPAQDNPDGSVTIRVPAEQVQKCRAEGGCRMFTRLDMETIEGNAYEAGKEEGLVEAIQGMASGLEQLVKAKAAEICKNSI
jgi:hypothetical protein